MYTLKWLYRIEIQCHKRIHLKPNAAINYREISSVIYETIFILNKHNFQYKSLYVSLLILTLNGPGFLQIGMAVVVERGGEDSDTSM